MVQDRGHLNVHNHTVNNLSDFLSATGIHFDEPEQLEESEIEEQSGKLS